MINGIYFLIGIIVIMVYDFGITMIDMYFRKKRKHIDIEIINGKLYVDKTPVENLDIHIEN